MAKTRGVYTRHRRVPLARCEKDVVPGARQYMRVRIPSLCGIYSQMVCICIYVHTYVSVTLKECQNVTLRNVAVT